ncbi:hypothetical protein N9K02_02190 [Gammaproteobacteria bacterium]|nr:hypothetical protein [Gammaproteobacteria bacterium]
MIRLLLFLICFPLASQELADVLYGKERLNNSFSYNTINKNILSLPSSDIELNGNFALNIEPLGYGYTVIRDEKDLHKKSYENFPYFDLNFLITKGSFHPENTRLIKTSHKFWDIQFGKGVTKFDKDLDIHFVIFPFNLVHKNANCIHNGIGIFSISSSNDISNTLLQVASETCAYYKFDYVALYKSTFNKMSLDNNIGLEDISIVKPISSLYTNFNINNKSFADSDSFHQDDVTLFGLIDGDNHYSSSCFTRLGNHPICDQVLLPSYSLAKSIAGTLSLSLIEAEYKNVTTLKVMNLVEECSQSKWKNISLEDLSDMSTGQYNSLIHDIDESGIASLQFIFLLNNHKDKLKKACKAFPKKMKSGKRFVYHTSDTYILGAAMNSYLKKSNKNADFFNDYLVPFLKKNNFSQVSNSTLRTNDDANQPFTGWGMFFLQDDLLHLSQLMHTIKDNKFTDLQFMHEALNPNEDNSLLAISSSDIYYNNGIWSRKFDKAIFNCNKDVWIPFMSGFGGITLALLPNGMTYYYFSDGYTFAWESAVIAANSIKPFC